MAGLDYAVARSSPPAAGSVTSGVERDGAADTDAPYAELAAEIRLRAEVVPHRRFRHTLEERRMSPASPTRRSTASLQRAACAHPADRRVRSRSPTNPRPCRAARGQADVDGETTRVRGRLSYLPTKNWTVSATFDHDRVKSDDTSRGLRRARGPERRLRVLRPGRSGPKVLADDPAPTFAGATSWPPTSARKPQRSPISCKSFACARR
jgi:hypothetical protein